MNNDRRKRIAEARAKIAAAFDILEEARSLLDDLKSEERDAFENLPEGLQQADNGQKMDAAATALESAYDEIDGFDFDSIYTSLDEAAD